MRRCINRSADTGNGTGDSSREGARSAVTHLEGLALTLATPNAENEGHLDLGQVLCVETLGRFG